MRPPGAGLRSLKDSPSKTAAPSRVHFRKIRGPGAGGTSGNLPFRRNMETGEAKEKGCQHRKVRCFSGSGAFLMPGRHGGSPCGYLKPGHW